MAASDDPTLSTFEPLVGETFRVRNADGQEADFQLVEAVNLGSRMSLPDGFRVPFSLLFRPGDDDVDWSQGTFEFQHATFGVLSAFCVAVLDPKRPGLPAYEVLFA
jgi:hypothetical protein